MRLVLDNPDLRAIPGNLRRLGGQAGNEAEQVQRYLPGDVRRYRLGDAGLSARVRQPVSGSGRAAGRAVTGRRAEPGVPEQVIPMRMRGKPCHNGLAQLAKVVREGGHFAAEYPGVDEQRASPAVHDNGHATCDIRLIARAPGSIPIKTSPLVYLRPIEWTTWSSRGGARCARS